MTANARVLEIAIRKMLSHPLAEVRQIGEKVKEVAKSETPTLVKYADVVPYLAETYAELNLESGSSRARQSMLPKTQEQAPAIQNWCCLIDYDKNGESKVLAAALYRFGEMSFAGALAHIKSLKKKERVELAETLLKRLGKFDVPLRELEYCNYTFDLVMDQGAYAEFKRHRMMSQTPQRLTTQLGYSIPRLVTEAGFASRYEAAMESASRMHGKLCELNTDIAQYIVPNGFNRRVLAQFNLREAFAFCQLRSAANAHFSIRRVAQRMYEEMAHVHPLLTKYIKLHDETWQDVEKNHFTNV
jgi:thymidylate synthase ThyX